MTATSLNPLRFPLRGSQLIEASAGTGKTFTIAALYLRLVLGHGEGDTAFTRALTPPEILVVTFTDAATKELRDRIRVRLAQAAACFRGSDDGADALLLALRAEYPACEWPRLAHRLQLAAESMDEAAVSTIHGWCHRMLREHAFDSGSLFSQRLETEQSELRAEVVRDYWRRFMSPMSAAVARALRHWWRSPEALQKSLKDVLAHARLLEPADDPAQLMQPWVACLQKLKAPFMAGVDELQQLLDEANGQEKRPFNGTLQKRWYDGWLQTLRTWRDDSALELPKLSEAAWNCLTPDGMAAAWHVPAEAPRHPLFAAIRDLRGQLDELPTIRPAVLRHAACWVAQRFDEEQGLRAQMGFNDLLTRLDQALAGPNAQRLAEAVRRQFPAALIDEFQDTDAVQYRIFDAIYRVSGNHRDTALVLIGDPKQAIYAFRGADIHTYLAARTATEGRHHTLGRNFRSTHAMVAATNRCFELAERRTTGQGAFGFRMADGINPVPFIPADAQGRSECWRVDDRGAAALTVWRLPAGQNGKPPSKEHYRNTMAAVCASELARLLVLGQQRQAGFVKDGELRALRPADIAVLVNNGTEARAVREALAERGVRSVYLSESDSVFQRPEALELQRWLTACAMPDDGQALRAALATPALGLSWSALDRLNTDEAHWDERVQQFHAYRSCWRSQGVLPMLRRLLNDFHVPARLLAAGSEGERRLTDLLHLAELMQQAAAALDGEQALIRHLAQECQDEQVRSGDARQLRLESDAGLVQVVTIHKSKGLEYPLVFLPFACNFRETTAKDLPLKWHAQDGSLRIELAGTEEGVERADVERLGEDLRKLYVALTRARHATWIGMAPLDKLHLSALGYLLGGELKAGVDELAGGYEDIIRVVDDPQPGNERYRETGQAACEGSARQAHRPLREHWWVASYSALSTETRGQAVAESALAKWLEGQAPDAGHAIEAGNADASAGAGATTTGRVDLHDLPAGDRAGVFLHGLLEWTAQQGFASLLRPGDTRLLAELTRRCEATQWRQRIDPQRLHDWLQHFLRLPLPVSGEAATPLVLAEAPKVVAEMEFWIAVDKVSVASIDALVRRHTLGNAPRPVLRPATLNGMVKGFIDLVVEHEGRYYVIDYKSTRLGFNDAAYTRHAMAKKVLEQRYELQYVLYLLALHRLLKLRLPGYDYDRHVGGALYLFLRGNQAPSKGVHAERPPRKLIEELDALLTSAKPKEAA